MTSLQKVAFPPPNYVRLGAARMLVEVKREHAGRVLG